MSLKIRSAPRIVEKLNLEGKGFEDLYWIGNHIILDNGYDSILLKKSINGGIYRKLDADQKSDDPNVVRISYYSLMDFVVKVECFEPIENAT